MRGVVSGVMSGPFWWGVGATIVALWLYRSYGSRLPSLPGASGGSY
jgi:hypothetical protein